MKLMRRSVTLILFCAASWFLPACSPANPAPGAGPHGPALVRRSAATYRFYDVAGAEPAEMLASMRAAAPGGSAGYGRTDWAVGWRAAWSAAGSTCRASRVNVTTNAVVTLPRWTAPSGSPPRVEAQWDSFVVALSRHEAGHVDLATAAGRQVRQAIEQMSASSCSGMDARARVEAAAILDAYRARNEEYDARTRHGATQNAVWPYVSTGAALETRPDSASAARPAAADSAQRHRPRTWGSPRP